MKNRVLLWVSLFMFAQLVIIGFQIDSWPFSNYPMFSTYKPSAPKESLHLQVTKKDSSSYIVSKSQYKPFHSFLTRAQKSAAVDESLTRDILMNLSKSIGLLENAEEVKSLAILRIYLEEEGNNWVKKQQIIYKYDL